MKPYAVAFMAMASAFAHPIGASATAAEYGCTIQEAFHTGDNGKLESSLGWAGRQFSVNRETGKVLAASASPLFAAPTARQVVLFGGGRGEPFSLISVNRNPERGADVEFLAVQDKTERSRSTFLAFGVAGTVFTGTCEER